MDLASPEFWVAVVQIIAIDIVLGGDNAVVIALACRKLPERQRNLGIMWGVAGAIGLRVILIFFALYLLAIPFLKVVGAALLFWIGIKLLQPEAEDGGEHDVQASTTLIGAIKTIVVADAVMSLDNVIAIAGAAKGSLGLVIFGLVVSVPIIVWGSKFVMRLMDRFPVVIVLGGALLGWIAGDMTVTDVALEDWMSANVPFANWIGPVVGAALVIVVGRWVAARADRKRVAVAMPAPAVAAVAAPAVAAGFVQRLLLPVDASENAVRAVDYVIAMQRRTGPFELHVVNVQGDLPADVTRFIARESIDEYRRENSEQALAPARRKLEAAGVPYSAHMLTGKPWDAISDYAAANQCDLIVMGTRGMGLHTGGLLGSVALGVAQRSPVPLLLVR